MSLSRRLRRSLLVRATARRGVVGLLLVNWILLTVGVPLPLPVAKDRSQPFPCMDGQCACRSASACWKSCCCHTDTEKVLWARRHGVTPPAFVIAAARKEAAQLVRGRIFAAGHSSCCQKSQVSDSHSSCCEKDADHKTELDKLVGSLAKEMPREELVTEVNNEPDTSAESDYDTITLTSLLTCQGKQLAGLFYVEALPSVHLVEFQQNEPPRAWLVLSNQHAEQLASLPPVPPPEQTL